MSRLAIASVLFAVTSLSLTPVSHADQPVRFAQPPHAQPFVQDRAEVPDMPPSMRAPVLDRDTVRAALLQARKANLARFRAYQKKGVFPSNTFGDGKLNVWRDDAGHFCAAATLILMSGNDDLVTRVAEQNNFIRLADVKQGPLMDWILTSGFTQAEIAAIQEPFMDVREPSEPTLAVVDPALRAAEDARLKAKYKQVDRMLVKNQNKSLDLAVDRLMKNQTLAWSVVHATME